jgi:Tol biopolymer transport system component
LDPSTERATPVVSGIAHEEGATFSPDGRWIFFARVSPDEGLFVARSDGSDIHRVLGPGDRLTWTDWSQNGDRIVATGLDASGVPETLLIDPRGGPLTTLRLGRTFRSVQGRYGTGDLVLTEDVKGGVEYWLVNANGTGLRQIPASTSAINEPALSPDGSKLAYATWDSGDGRGERIHVLDIDAELDRPITTDTAAQLIWQGAQFSPDGTKILTTRNIPNAYTYRLAVIPSDGVGAVVLLGGDHTSSSGGVDTGGADYLFSPDGTKVYAFYRDDSTTWLFDAATGTGQEVHWPASGYISWQRLAP